MDMSQRVMPDTPKRSETDLKGFSCLSCRQRKIRCDKRAPCLNCTKADRQCSFIAPVRGKRKRTKPPRETLHARLKRYEDMLKAYGAKIEPETCDDVEGSESETESRLTPESNVNFANDVLQSQCRQSQLTPEPSVDFAKNVLQSECRQSRLTPDSNVDFAKKVLQDRCGHSECPTMDYAKNVLQNECRQSECLQDKCLQSECASEDSKPQFIMKEGASRYFDSALWSNISGDFQHPESTNFNDVGESVPIEQDGDVDEAALFFEPERCDKAENLSRLHASMSLFAKFKEVYADRVDPMLKLVHLPTFWASVTEALQCPQNIPKSLESLIFAFYLVTVCSLNDEESQDMFGAPTSVVISRYRIATRQALINARFLSTSNIMTLQAFTIFILCVRNAYRCDTLYILSGVAIRLARKMGLHRDGTFLGLSPFETEMRRRIWWHLAHVDCRTADVMGTKPSPEISYGDTKKPINVEDDELHPDMKTFPVERNGITAISLCLLKCEIMETLCKFAAPGPTDLRWEMLYSPQVSLVRKDSIIDTVEDHLEKKYLRYCDPSNPLHTFTSVMIRSAVCKMRLFAHNKRQFAHPSSKATQHDHDVSFFNAMKLLEYANLIQGGHLGVGKYMWQIGTSYLWNTMLYLLIEVRCRKTGPDVEKAWQLIAVVFTRCPQVLEEFTGSVYVALGKWTIEVWDSYIAASKAEGLPEPVTPDYINEIREFQRVKMESRVTKGSSKTEARPATRQSSAIEKFSYADYLDGGFSDSQYLPNLFSFDSDPNQWLQWEQMAADQGI